MKSIAIIASFRNEAETLEKFISDIEKESKKYKNIIKYKIIFVNDFSTDQSEKIIKKKMKTNKKILLINTKKNYGGSHCIHHAFNFVPKNYFVTVIDCDLQDPINLIFKTLCRAKKSKLYHLQRTERDEEYFQLIYTKLAYIILSIISFNKIVFNSNYFKIIPPCVANKIKVSNEIYPYWNYFISKFASQFEIIEYKRKKRRFGKSKFNIFNTNPWATFYSALGNFFFNSTIFFTACLALSYFIFYKIPILNFVLILIQLVNLLSFVIFYLVKTKKKKNFSSIRYY